LVKASRPEQGLCELQPGRPELREQAGNGNDYPDNDGGGGAKWEHGKLLELIDLASVAKAGSGHLPGVAYPEKAPGKTRGR
jgi:hypothetical protein